MTANPHVGSSFDDFLAEEGILAETSAIAIKRAISWQISQEMEKKGLSKTQMAEAMQTSRAALERLLDPENTSVTLKTIERAAAVLGKQIHVELVDSAA